MGTLTAFPIRPPSRVGASTARVAMVAAPFAVLPIALAAGAVGEVGRLVECPPLVLAAVIITIFALGSRGLHLDGLADTADGLTSSYDRERALEIMRRGNTGPAGVAAVVLALLVQSAALAAVLALPWGLLTGIVLLCLARSSLLIACAAGIPAARDGGLGAMVAGVVPRVLGGVGALVAAAIGAAVTVLSGRPWWQGIVAVALAAVVVAGLVLRCRKRFGGITGDVLGAVIEVAAAALLVALAAGR
ncbi:adenosylcobinamide-GDP ribazoletransferase [Nakamurella sp. UYEF19]|uniref:adenosylcobinamide-GDP ribazoletransferase n=1 Tax=Nakamurella sp. UYEF19 TaxID=1756392 RepID=UPI00339AFE7A